MTLLNEASDYLMLPKVSPRDVLDELSGAQLVSMRPKELLSKNPGRVVVDSRKLEKGCIYIAIKGERHDGHDGIDAAAKAEASLIISEKALPNLKSVAHVVVTSTRAAWSWAASTAWGHPQKEICVLGVTGTNGKTSTVWMIKSLLSACDVQTATIGTLGCYVGETLIPTTHTTPDPDVLYGLLRMAVTKGCQVVAMEVASHALHQKKVAPILFSAAAFTSFSQDHLDLHKTMEEYLKTKLTLFSGHLKQDALSVLHESVYEEAKAKLPKKLATAVYGERVGCDCLVKSQLSPTRTSQQVQVTDQRDGSEQVFSIPFLGHIFALNFSAAVMVSRFTVTHILKRHWPKDISSRLETHLLPVPGRLEPVTLHTKPGRPLVLVDYAHTPDALEKSLEEARKITPRRLVVVFGCGGDRDPSKREVMGRIAQRNSDYVFITNDNPRTEAAERIASDILKGIENHSKVTLELDRRAAITAAVNSATVGDTILVAGKGHETYQLIGTRSAFFSDVDEAKKALDLKKNWCVIGAGVSGISAAELLLRCGDSVAVSDGGVLTAATKERLTNAGARVFDNGHRSEHLKGISSLVLSPGVSKSNPLLTATGSSNRGLCTEIDLGLESHQGKLIAVTGTNGKSTTCALFEYALRSFGYQANACGNIGLPPSALGSDEKSKDSFLVCELSSYQLEQSLTVNSEIAVITSFSFDHLSRHGSLKTYFQCKWKVVEGVKPGGLILLREDVFRYAREFSSQFPAENTIVVCDRRPAVNLSTDILTFWWPELESIQSYSGEICSLKNLSLPGVHNAVNAAFVVAGISHLTKRSYLDISKNFLGFFGLPFRCQLIGKTLRGFPIINDSKSTNVESTLIALSSSRDPLILLVGGAGKGESFRPLLNHKDRILKLIAFGSSRDDILRDTALGFSVSSHESLKDAVSEALELSSKTDAAILLSPACASFDEFRNFEDRGVRFNEWVSSLINKE